MAEIESESLAGQRATAAAAAERRRATTAELRRIEGELDFAARVERYRMDLAEMAGRSEDLKLSIAYLELAASSVETIALVKRTDRGSLKQAAGSAAG